MSGVSQIGEPRSEIFEKVTIKYVKTPIKLKENAAQNTVFYLFDIVILILS